MDITFLRNRHADILLKKLIKDRLPRKYDDDEISDYHTFFYKKISDKWQIIDEIK